MYSIPEALDNTEYNEWINQDLLLKDSRRQTAGDRKRRYDLTTVDVEEHDCDEHLSRRILRPRHNPEPLSSPGASRTRPMRSNRSRRRLPTVEQPPVHVTPVLPEVAAPPLSSMDPLQAFTAYNWPQNYLVAHTDPSIAQRLPSANFHNIGQTVPHFDPWILHNYLLASTGYAPISTGSHVTHDSVHDTHIGYASAIPDNVLNHNFIWQYPFLLNPVYSPLQSQVTRPPELGLNISSHNFDSQPDLSYLFRPTNTSRTDVASNDSNNRIYHSEQPIINYSNHMLPLPFSYGSLCPYHNINHVIHHNQQSSHLVGNSSSNLPEHVQHQQQPFNPYRNHSEMNFGHYWPHVTPTIRSSNYPINGSNIDTLLHLAAHFEQRKRGITREELDKLPTHRHKTTSEKAKRAKMCTEKSKFTADDSDNQKCLVCLDEFESKQSIRTLHCSHEFHAKCIDKWLKINRTCPLCRADAFDGAAQKDGA